MEALIPWPKLLAVIADPSLGEGEICGLTLREMSLPLLWKRA